MDQSWPVRRIKAGLDHAVHVGEDDQAARDADDEGLIATERIQRELNKG
jgi:hypothetical protein